MATSARKLILSPKRLTTALLVSLNGQLRTTGLMQRRWQHDIDGSVPKHSPNRPESSSSPFNADVTPKPSNSIPWTTESLKNMQGFSSNLSPVVSRLQYATSRLKTLTENVNSPQEALQKASTALNELTGYTHIEGVKQKVLQQEESFETCRKELRNAKTAYEDAVDARSSTQREINELLQRKHTWTGEDVTRFTELYRLEHLTSQQEATAKENYRQSEKLMDRQYMELTRAIMERYHEEQLWSDKIRSVSTYGTWALMVVNLILFVAVQTVFEPIKRKRLTDRFEDLLVQKVAEEESKFQDTFEQMESRNKLILEKQDTLINTLMASTQAREIIPDTVTMTSEPDPDLILPAVAAAVAAPVYSKPSEILHASYSDTVSMTKKDLIIYTVEGALVGSAITALLRLYF